MQHLLIVEDDCTQCDTLTALLSKEYPDWTIESATSYESALDLLLNSSTKFTLFLLDIQLTSSPGDRSGFLLAEHIRKKHCYFTTPILFLTSITDSGMYALSEFHCYNYITKPYTFSDILFQIKQMLLTGYLKNAIRIIDTDRVWHNVFLQDICSIEAKHRSVVITTTRSSILTRQFTFDNISDILTEDFFQCHRKYIINTKHITTYDKKTHIIGVGQNSIPVSRKYESLIYKLL